MAQYPIRFQLNSSKPAAAKPDNRPAKPVTQRDLDRHARTQGQEAKESSLVKKAKGGGVGKHKPGRGLAGMPAPKAMGSLGLAKGGKCYAKGGSIDGVAKQGRTKAKKVVMASGGKTRKGC